MSKVPGPLLAGAITYFVAINAPFAYAAVKGEFPDMGEPGHGPTRFYPPSVIYTGTSSATLTTSSQTATTVGLVNTGADFYVVDQPSTYHEGHFRALAPNLMTHRYYYPDDREAPAWPAISGALKGDWD